MIKKCGILLLSVFLLSACAQKTETTPTKTKNESETTKVNTAPKKKMEVTTMKLTTREKNLLNAVAGEVYGFDVKGLTKENKEIFIIVEQYKNGKLLSSETSEFSASLNQDETNEKANILILLEHEDDDLKIHRSILLDDGISSVAKGKSSVPFKVDSVSSSVELPVHLTSGKKALIAYVSAMEEDGTHVNVQDIQTNPKKALKNTSRAFLFYVQVD
ncbi:hypothetical protein [Bacillus sp. NPDC077027]|uniref:hypothetical protein n=1 Tax=Bacillus sp. NPDC077027 TaxID=3390548 RepID=UPI003CFF1EE8